MGVEKIILKKGNGIDIPRKHDEVSMEYTGWLYSDDAPDKRGKQFDSSVGRGDLITPIGVGRVIRGWDEGILGSASSAPMTLGEKTRLTISADYGYGAGNQWKAGVNDQPSPSDNSSCGAMGRKAMCPRLPDPSVPARPSYYRQC